MTIIHPGVGRRLWYWASAFDRGELEHKPASVMTASNPSQPCDAGIAYVHSDRLVNLTVSDHNGVVHQRTSVRLVQPGDAPPPAGVSWAQWMPYQVQQAVKEQVGQQPGMHAFVFELEQPVAIRASGEQGEVIGRCERVGGEDQYLVRYADASGRAVENWWGVSALAAVAGSVVPV